ncbi:MAG TPA: NUDIX domain-containing protein [Candidatus Magasanikbacteria bacterium]|nr:NUDIX domain-containing protein [Candidatus Magasanikbacteria bacterium]
MKKGIDYTGITTAFCCHDERGQILLSRRSQKCRDEQGCWDIGAGGLEFGLSPEENMHKEISEEYGAEIIDFTPIGTRSVNRKLVDGTPTHWIAFDYLVKIKRETAKIGEPNSIDEIGWFDLQNLPNPLHSQLPLFLEKYKDVLNKINQA